ncbi:MAG: NAD-dependent dihydropyrimidine dehydrogenase subunit PreA [Erysipelotrichaceae bacterium]|nr:NAD-dependent dihydropyrimidine dehydrogenase subunit PreA [Erysipelotrichaceae bacterium]
MTNYNECLLCNNAACTRACGVKDPAKILRSLHFENYNVVRNNLDESNSCLDCDQRCVDACPEKIDIPSVFSSLYEHPLEEKTKIDRDILKCDFCGIPLENPFLLSSSVVASTYDMCARAFEAGWAGAAFKTICLMDIVEASPRFSAIKGDNNRIIGFKNIEQLSDHSLSENLKIFKQLKKDYPNKLLLVSIMGRNDEEWAYLAKLMEENCADALELNFSCPNMTEDNTGSDVGQIPELVEHYCRIVKQSTKLPFIAKLTPNVTHIEDSAEAAIRGGADGVAAINTIKSLIEVDINPYDGSFYSSIGGYSGKAVKPIALRFIAELAKDKDLKDHHISAMGGIENWVDALEFIALGADTVQVTTAVMQFGYRIVEDLIDGAAYYLNANGFSSIEDLKGTAVPNVVPTEELDRSFVIYPRFDRNKCVGCQRCYVSCMDGGHQAISIRDGKPVLDPKKCVGCHLCILVCPKQAAVSSQIRVPKKQG